MAGFRALGGPSWFAADRRTPKPFAPDAHVIGQIRVPVADPNGRRLNDLGFNPVPLPNAPHLVHGSRGGYAHTPRDAYFVPDPRALVAPFRAEARPAPSTYGAGLVSLPGWSSRVSSVFSAIFDGLSQHLVFPHSRTICQTTILTMRNAAILLVTR